MDNLTRIGFCLIGLALILKFSQVPGCVPINVHPVSPIGNVGTKVLIVEDVGPEARADLSESQKDILNSKDIRNKLKSVCTVVPGKDTGFRYKDSGSDVSNESHWVQEAMKIPHATLPWMFIFHNDTWYSMAIEKEDTVDTILAKLDTYTK
jgi:hypothetical protein